MPEGEIISYWPSGRIMVGVLLVKKGVKVRGNQESWKSGGEKSLISRFMGRVSVGVMVTKMRAEMEGVVIVDRRS